MSEKLYQPSQRPGVYEPIMSEMSPSDRIAAERDALVVFMPDEKDRASFEELINCIPEEARAAYYVRLRAHLAHPNAVAGKGGVRGLLYELGLIRRTIRDGLEQVDFAVAQNLGPITFYGYSKNADLTQAPDKQFSSELDLDVPIKRDDMPYAFEAKTCFRRAFGTTASDYNQLLKYQSAIDQEVLAGACLRLQGRLDEHASRWMTLGDVHQCAVPDVELLYTLNLPSGLPYTTCLKPARDGKGLRYRNPLLTEKADSMIAQGLDRASTEGHLGGLIAAVDRELDVDEVAPATPEEFEVRKRMFIEELYSRLLVFL